MAQISGWIDILPLGLSKVRYRTTGGRVERRERAGRRERARRERGTKERSFVPIFLLIIFFLGNFLVVCSLAAREHILLSRELALLCRP